ncbi:unnamed protein product [Owenia fusiformis]|uniref:Uncharacterized protein n=1 Tax=Owenia fusiformis TaxID=6347 RepID=A0A8J1XKH6_OWEFU|nr:unnamed protein product [Owenia fusiformis]
MDLHIAECVCFLHGHFFIAGFVSHGPELRKRHVIINNRWRTVQMKQRNPSQYFDDDEKLYKCDKCMFTTAHKTSITRHVDVMHGDKKNSGVFHCDQCPKKCRTAYLLNEHIHGKHQAGYMCDLCGKKLGTKGGLRHHKREIHEGRFRFVCKICDMKFRSGEAMDGHMNSVHTLKAPYICEKCARSYYHKRSLKNHLKFCVGPKGKPTIITCDFDGCGLTFLSNGGKIDHIAAMHTNKQHICNVCSKSYPYRSSLTKHRRAMGHKKFPNIKKEKVEIDDGEIEPVEDMGIGVEAAVVEKDNIVDDDDEIPEKDGTFDDGDNNNQDELDI